VVRRGDAPGRACLHQSQTDVHSRPGWVVSLLRKRTLVGLKFGYPSTRIKLEHP
jgi:hypothetical protein